MITVRQRVTSLFKSIFSARPLEKIAEWAKRNITLSTEESGDFPGRYDPDLNPLPTVLFDVYQSGEWDEAIIKKSSQSGVTLAVLILITWFCAFVKRNFMYVLDSRDEMKKVSQARLQPMLKSSKASGGYVKPEEDSFTNLFLQLKGFVGYLCGSRSVGALANKSVALAICDEVDAYVLDGSPSESAPHNLARDRLKKQSKGFLVLLSKPANEEDTITQEFLTGSRHKCFVPCPHCSEKEGKPSGFQELVWERGKLPNGEPDYGVKFSHCKDMLGAYDLERVARETYYECVHCRGAIQEHHKPWMIQHRDWRRTNFGQDKHKPVPRKFSCEITDLYSTFPKTSWAALAQEWIDAQGSIDKIKRFKRGRLAQGWVEKKQDVKSTDVEKCVGEYEQGHCPVMPDVVIQCSDRQADVFKWVKMGFRKGIVDHGWIIDEGECGTFGDFLRAADKPVIIDHWEDIPEDERTDPTVLTGMVDEGYKTYQIREHCLSTKLEIEDEIVLRFYPVKGRGGIQVKDIVWEVEGTTQNGDNVPVFHISDDDFKSMLYEEAIAGRSHIQRSMRDEVPALAPLLHIFKNPDPLFIDEFCQEHRIMKIVRNKATMIWAEPRGAQDKGDAAKYCLATWYRIRSKIGA
jgi:phage terminase large subunit GpA-like protein